MQVMTVVLPDCANLISVANHQPCVFETLVTAIDINEAARVEDSEIPSPHPAQSPRYSSVEATLTAHHLLLLWRKISNIQHVDRKIEIEDNDKRFEFSKCKTQLHHPLDVQVCMRAVHGASSVTYMIDR